MIFPVLSSIHSPCPLLVLEKSPGGLLFLDRIFFICFLGRKDIIRKNDSRRLFASRALTLRNLRWWGLQSPTSGHCLSLCRRGGPRRGNSSWVSHHPIIAPLDPKWPCGIEKYDAESEGFEPSDRFPGQQLSRLLHSTALATLPAFSKITSTAYWRGSTWGGGTIGDPLFTNFLKASPPLYLLIWCSRNQADFLSGNSSLYTKVQGRKGLVEIFFPVLC